MRFRLACLVILFFAACAAPTHPPEEAAVTDTIAKPDSVNRNIDGNWILVENVEFGKKIIPYRYPQQIKTFRDGYFTLFMYDSNGQFEYAGAGPFLLEGDRFFETFEYASVPKNVGASDWQRWRLLGDTLFFYGFDKVTMADGLDVTDSMGRNKFVEKRIRAPRLKKAAFTQVNGLRLYYEIYGEGDPVVLIHGGGSTIQSTWANSIPLLEKNNQLIAVDLQAHGRSGDRPGPLSFEQDADDVNALLNQLNIPKATIMGFSNGANTALQVAVRHPERCKAVIACSPLLKKNGAAPGFWNFIQNGTFAQMPASLKKAFLAVNPDSAKLQNMYAKDAQRMRSFRDMPDAQLEKINVPVLFINGENDVATKKHIDAMAALTPHAQVLVFPGGHGNYLGELSGGAWNQRDWAIPSIITFLKGVSVPTE